MSDEELLMFMEEEGGAFTYATINPADKNTNVVLTNGDLTGSTITSGSGGMRSTISKSSDKWYWEILCEAATILSGVVGVADADEPLNSNMINTGGWGYFLSTGQLYHNNSLVSGGHPAVVADDVVSLAFDSTGGKLWLAVNNVWIGSGDPAADSNPSFSGIPGDIFSNIVGGNTGSEFTAGYGASAFAYSVPSGFNSGLYE